MIDGEQRRIIPTAGKSQVFALSHGVAAIRLS
jgi:hypothetical protein